MAAIFYIPENTEGFNIDKSISPSKFLDFLLFEYSLSISRDFNTDFLNDAGIAFLKKAGIKCMPNSVTVSVSMRELRDYILMKDYEGCT